MLCLALCDYLVADKAAGSAMNVLTRLGVLAPSEHATNNANNTNATNNATNHEHS